MSTTIQYIRIEREVNKKTMLTTWGTDWYNLWCSQLLYYTLDLTRYNKSMLKIWGDDYNIDKFFFLFAILNNSLFSFLNKLFFNDN